ncbi:fungal hydrophobin [Mycena rebaudengoi]|nr:fungal hydrophobin [Mycena rebaudengoi]
MFSKLSVIVTSALIALAAASPTARAVIPATIVQGVASILGLDLSGLNVPIGLGCSPLTLIGNNCGDTTVNCAAPAQQWAGLIAINCLVVDF